jgi:hypothetical protein
MGEIWESGWELAGLFRVLLLDFAELKWKFATGVGLFMYLVSKWQLR